MTGTPDQQTPHAAAALMLAWYRDMGVDAALDDVPLDWLARGDARPGADFELPEPVAPPQRSAPTPAGRPPLVAPKPMAPNRATPPWDEARPQAPRPDTRPGDPRPRPSLVPTTPQPATTRQFSVAPPDEATLQARATAREATDINDLAARLAAFDGCGLKATAKSLCFYRGAAPARIMIVGEAPGGEEDKAGQPFVGPAGQLLDKMLAAIDLGEANAHITNIVYWRPPGNRTPTLQETMVCRPFLERQVELVKPEVILLLGGPAAKHILDMPEGIMKLRGKWRDVEIGRHKVRAMATLHPTYLLRTPLAKRMVWKDLLTIDAALRQG